MARFMACGLIPYEGARQDECDSAEQTIPSHNGGSSGFQVTWSMLASHRVTARTQLATYFLARCTHDVLPMAETA
jgi:hypothetical protein